MAQFSFTFDYFTILETRSRHLDTDFATLSVGVNTPVGGKSPQKTSRWAISTMARSQSISCSRTSP